MTLNQLLRIADAIYGYDEEDKAILRKAIKIDPEAWLDCLMADPLVTLEIEEHNRRHQFQPEGPT